MNIETLLLILIIPAVYQDIRYKKISILIIIMGIMISLPYRLIIMKSSILGIMLDLSPGILIFILAYFGKEIIGYGDAAIFTMTGLMLGLWKNIELMLLSMVINSLYGGILLICKKKKMKDAIAFVPSIFVAYVGIYIADILRTI